jgi:hypothetical protein
VGRVRQIITVDGRECWTLFDTGARNTYVVQDVADTLPTWHMPRPMRTALGGYVREIAMSALLGAEIEGRLVSVNAMVVDEIGRDEDDRRIEVLLGALDMQHWGIRPVPDEERLDLTHYPEEFVEF